MSKPGFSIRVIFVCWARLRGNWVLKLPMDCLLPAGQTLTAMVRDHSPIPAEVVSMSDKSARLSECPEPPYYAVIFRSQRQTAGADDYEVVAERMTALAAEQPGFLDVFSFRDVDGSGVTVSYWSSPEAIDRWRTHAEHQIAQHRGREEFYASYTLEVCRVERVSGMST